MVAAKKQCSLPTLQPVLKVLALPFGAYNPRVVGGLKAAANCT